MAERALDRLAVRLLEGLGTRLWGFPPRLMSYLVAEMGPVGALAWFARNMPRYERTLRVLGSLRTHLACTVISLANGCRYCAFGHAYAVELVHLAEHDKLLPCGAETIAEWRELTPGALRDAVVDLLERADLHGEVLWVDRTLALVSGTQQPVDRDEARIAHLVRMFAVLNAVGKAADVAPDEAHDPRNKDLALKARITRMRQSAA